MSDPVVRPAPLATYADLEGRVAIVTGGSLGIGAATCHELAHNGVKVAVVARGAAGVAGVVEELQRAGATAVGIPTDCTDLAALEEMVATVERTLGPPGILVAFAGGFLGRTPILDISEAEWRAVIDSNLTATFLTLKAVLPGMVERRAGAVVTMSSISGRFIDLPVTASYAAAKAGIAMLTRHVALEVGPHNVRCNAVAPGTTVSERVSKNLSPEALDRVASMSPLRRIGLPEDTAAATCFLVSDASSWLTGVTLDVAGGRVML